ncbi:hypothetical protein MHZ93_23035 [Roseomonas sp. ACRSG]|nr:hypothetical protein [Roseomonas sp. ACRSG]
MLRRALTFSFLLATAGCADIGRPWPDLSEKQRAELETWQTDLRKHIGNVLMRSGRTVVFTNEMPAVPGGGAVETIRMSLLIDRSGVVQLVKILDASVVPGEDMRLLSIITAAGPVPPPPPSLVAFGERLNATVTVNRPVRPQRPQTA